MSRTVLGPFSAFFSLGKPCRKAWQEMRVACFECIYLCSLERCQKARFRWGSLCFGLSSCLLSSLSSASGWHLFRLLRRAVHSGPEARPTWGQVGPKIGPSWPMLARLGGSWPRRGASWPKWPSGWPLAALPGRHASMPLSRHCRMFV